MAEGLALVGRALRVELRLLCRHWSYGLLHLLWAAFVVLPAWGDDLGSAQSWLYGLLRVSGLAALCLGALLLAGLSATRGRRTGFASLEAALPGAGALLVGRALAGLLAALPLLAVPLLVAAWAGPWPSFARAAPFFLLATLPSILVAVALAWAVATVLPVGARGLLGLLLLLWLGLNLAAPLAGALDAPLAAGPLLAFGGYPAPAYDELWATGAADLMEAERAPAPPGLRLLWLTGLGLGLLALALAAEAWRRDRRPPVLAALVCVTALGLGGLAGARYVGASEALRARFVADAGAYPWAPPTFSDGRVTRYDLRADLRDPARPSFEVGLTIMNDGAAPLTRLDMTLHADMLITGSDVTVDRADNFLTLRLAPPLAPGATREVRVAYAGAVRRGIALPDEAPRVVYFTGRHGVWLASEAGWYPLVGRVPIEGILLTQQLHGLAPAPFAARVEVLAPPGFGVATNLPPAGPGLFAGDDVRWLMLAASPDLAREAVGGVEVVGPRHDMAALRAPAAEYERVLAVARRFFPDAAGAGLTLLAVEQPVTLPYETPPSLGQLVVANGRQQFAAVAGEPPDSEERRYIYGRPLVAGLWRLGGGDTETVAFDAADRFVWSVVAAEGDPSRVGATPYPDLSEAPLVAALGDAYRDYGEATVAEVLRRMRAAPGNVTTEAQVRALAREVSGGR